MIDDVVVNDVLADDVLGDDVRPYALAERNHDDGASLTPVCPDDPTLKGLLVANLILNNWDLKTSNNRVYDVLDGDGARRRVYVVRDLGASSLDKTTFPTFLRRTPLRGMKQGSRNDGEGFAEQGFISDVQGNHVEFDYHGVHTRLMDALTVEGVVWMCKLMARISDRQWATRFEPRDTTTPSSSDISRR